jgi:hypothetical protein
MMKATLLASIASIVQSEKCCKTCADGLQKYYSVDMKHGHCGEACIKTSQFHLFKVFEKNLTIADGSTGYSSCADLGWPKYSETVTHGDPLGLLTCTLDLYDHRALTVPAGNVRLASFNKDDAEFHAWVQKNDPVMGGASRGTFEIVDNTGVMNGTVALIPSLQAPGFIKTLTNDQKAFADVSSCTGLELTTKSVSTPGDYTGYRVSFGSDSAYMQCGKFFARGFKADFTAGEGEFKTVQVPFNQFTKCWDDSTGDAIHTCAEDASFCPTSERLADLQTISLWAEGHAADVTLTIQSIDAYGCDANMVV